MGGLVDIFGSGVIDGVFLAVWGENFFNFKIV